MRRRHGYRHATRDGLGSTRVSCREAAAPHTEGRKCKMVMCQSKLLACHSPRAVIQLQLAVASSAQRDKNKTKRRSRKKFKDVLVPLP